MFLNFNSPIFSLLHGYMEQLPQIFSIKTTHVLKDDQSLANLTSLSLIKPTLVLEQ